jgi:short-subunit dehydrogenase
MRKTPSATAASPAGPRYADAHTPDAGSALRGRAVLVTGASRGIGAQIALTLAQAGADVAISARPASRDALEAQAIALRAQGGRVVVAPADLADRAARAQLVAACHRALGRIDILVNNAAVELPGPFAAQPPECLREQLETNLLAPMHLARLVLPDMVERGSGHIVSIGALAGRMPMPFHAVHAASKAGLAAWSASLREEIRGTGVGASLVCPGFVGGTGRHARLGPVAPWWFREVPAQVVGDAVLHAITRDIGETLLWPGPARPWVTLSQVVPAVARAWLRISGLRAFLEARAARATDDRRD